MTANEFAKRQLSVEEVIDFMKSGRVKLLSKKIIRIIRVAQKELPY